MTLAIDPLFEPAPSDVLRRQRNMDQWRRRSRIIHFLRKALPAAAISIVVGLIGWIIIKAFLATIIDVRGYGASIRMMNPKFYGRDGDGQAYMLGAEEASRNDRDFKQIVLVKPVISLNINNPDATSAKADRGQYHETDKILYLDGNVVFSNPEGYVFKTGKAVINTQNGVVEGNQTVVGTGPSGTIKADSYGIYDKGKRIIFRGNVRGRITSN
jgi:lipopolysaccharide export system protein LptC